MQFFKAILIVPSLALAVAAHALPEEFSTQACGNPMSAICPNGVATDDHDCTLSCMWGSCVEYDCGDGTSVSESPVRIYARYKNSADTIYPKTGRLRQEPGKLQ